MRIGILDSIYMRVPNLDKRRTEVDQKLNSVNVFKSVDDNRGEKGESPSNKRFLE